MSVASAGLLAARRAAGRVLAGLVDPTVALSFDRTGHRIHALAFRDDDLGDLSGRVCLITGANAGLGRAAALGLAGLGADVRLLCRSRERGEAAAEGIRKETGNPRVACEHVDLADLASVRAFAGRPGLDRVDVLVHNAGVLPAERRETADGLELSFATNVAGPFLLTRLLEPRLRRAAPSRLIWVSSGGMYARRLQLADPQWTRRPFDGVTAYAETKRAEVVLSRLFAERLAEAGVTSNAMHPGWADTPGVQSSLPRFHRLMGGRLRTPAQGADGIVWLAACPRVATRTGLFWLDRQPRREHWLPWTRESASDRQAFWRLCELACGVGARAEAGR